MFRVSAIHDYNGRYGAIIICWKSISVVDRGKHVILPSLHLVCLGIVLKVPELASQTGVYCCLEVIEVTYGIFL